LNYFELFKLFIKMKKILFVIVCMLVVSTTLSAQQSGNSQRPQRSPEEIAKQMTERVNTAVNLTPEQTAPIDSINLVFAQAQAKLRENANGDFASIREDMRKLNALQTEAYGKVLTDEQMQAYKKMQEERQQNRGNRGGGNRGGNNN